MRLVRSALLLSALALAYNPPVDTAGPLTVRMQEPALGSYGAGGLALLSQPGVIFHIPVNLENAAATEITGTLRLAVTDLWHVESPNPMPFKVTPHGRARYSFAVSFSEGTYAAHYPVHAYAEFSIEGKKLVAHPVLVLATKIPNPPRAPNPAEFQPVPVTARGALGLWRLPVRRETVRLTESSPTSRDTFESAPVFEYTASSIIMNLGPRAPSMRETVESARVEYPLSLPGSRPLRLSFKTSGVAKFRVLADGEELTIDNGACDLSRFAGRTIRLSLEAEGAAKATWIEPTLIAGEPTPPPVFPPAGTPRVLGRAGNYDVLYWPGTRGILDAAFGFRQGSKQILFQGFRVRVLDDALEDWRSVSELLEAKEEPATGRARIRNKFRNWAGTFDLVTEYWIEGQALRVRLWLENTPPSKPWFHVYLEEATAGRWSENAHRIYAGPGNVIVDPAAFRLGFDGHNIATSFVGLDFPSGISIVEAIDVPPTRLEVDPSAGLCSLNSAHTQTITFIPAANAWQAARVWRDMSPWKASPGVPKLAGRFVFDIWGSAGSYTETARALERAFRYGLTDAAVVYHVWQRWGYDYRLPDLYPPDPQFGTLEDFRSLVNVCTKAGVLFAPHDNYIDYYPDSEGFSYSNIVFQRDGTPYKAWFHYGPNAQSYRARPDRTRPFIERNLKLIKDGFAPTAYFIDVWSSIAPYDFWTSDGRFVDRLVTRREWGENFTWIRDYLGNNAPQISEAGHDQLIGWLDGAQANHLRVDPSGSGFTWRIKALDAERIPWIDAVYRDRFVLHGAGYPDRYAGGLDPATHGIYSDDYIATEILTGRPAMVHTAFSRDVVRKYWLTHDFLAGLGLKRIADVEFDGDNPHRQHVTYEGGGEAWVNRGDNPWTVAGHTLPPYGHYARVPIAGGLAEEAIETKDGVTIEWSQSPTKSYLNARGAGKPASIGDLSTTGALRLTREGAATLLIPLPASTAFEVRRKTTPPVSQAEALNENGDVIRSVPLDSSNGATILHVEPGVFAYRLR